MKKKLMKGDDNLYYAYKRQGAVKRNLISDQISGGCFNSDCLKVEGDKVIISFTEWKGRDAELKIIRLERVE